MPTCVIAVLLACVIWAQAAPGLARSTSAPNPAAVKTRIAKFGVGEHVMVKLTDGQELHGNITAIEQEGFKMHPDQARAEVAIPYDHVVIVKKNPGITALIIVGVVVLVIVVAVVALKHVPA